MPSHSRLQSESQSDDENIPATNSTNTAKLVKACWALSSDDMLQVIGTSNGIHYFEDYEEYLKILETGLWRKKSVINIIKEWDSRIFPNSDSSLVGKE
ncbi:hypothetical protein CVT25_015467 [Psilocybe cyanescens]|uniref:Uncharacterized protein n=1 Tax=Psilocybe cyanescens TaxID=93625 RepID=A0A409WS62_PSICY|nr:hypothetical protein CVT25_015467 [Psilocybe cyanescens]